MEPMSRRLNTPGAYGVKHPPKKAAPWRAWASGGEASLKEISSKILIGNHTQATTSAKYLARKCEPPTRAGRQVLAALAKAELPPRLTQWPSDVISHSDQALAKSTPVRRLASELEVAVGSAEPLQVEEREALNAIALSFSQLM